ncbi:MAG: hypothetical protein K6A92_04415 [Lachnospiraceae bacterium]|nr:hypothetical protein [Lachnospiraceae bacterium]
MWIMQITSVALLVGNTDSVASNRLAVKRRERDKKEKSGGRREKKSEIVWKRENKHVNLFRLIKSKTLKQENMTNDD